MSTPIPDDPDAALERARERFNAMPAAELRKRVDIGLRHIRELRNALAVESGMMLEGSDDRLPPPDPKKALRVLKELLEMLPLLHAPLTPEQRARLQPIPPGGRELIVEALDEMAADPEGLAELGIDISPEKIAELREGLVKAEMIGEVAREVSFYHAELVAHRDRLAESAREIAARIESRKRS